MSQHTSSSRRCFAWFRSLAARKWPGIGPVSAKQLEKLNIGTFHDLWVNRALVWHSFPKQQARLLVAASCGLDASASGGSRSSTSEAEAPAHQKSVSQERSFGCAVSDRGKIHERLSDLCERVAEEMQPLGLVAKTLVVRARLDKVFLCKSTQIQLPSWTNAPSDFWAAVSASQKVGGILQEQRSVWLVGVSAVGCRLYETMKQEALEGEKKVKLQPSVRDFFGSASGAVGKGGKSLGASTASLNSGGVVDPLISSRAVGPARATTSNPEIKDSRERVGRGNSSLCPRLWKLDSPRRTRPEEFAMVTSFDKRPSESFEDASAKRAKEDASAKRAEEDASVKAAPIKHAVLGDVLSDRKNLTPSVVVDEEMKQICFGGQVVQGFDCDEFLFSEEEDL